MPYLHRRIERLLKLLTEGKLKLSDRFLGDATERALQELGRVRKTPQGQIDLSTCGPVVRSLARTLHMIEQLIPEQKSSGIAPAPAEAPADLSSYQRELFEILDEFFRRATGQTPADFARPETFGREVRRHSEQLIRRSSNAFSWMSRRLESFYLGHRSDVYPASRQMGGMKLLLGGSQRFPATALRSVRSMLLYADTILIPDPVLPWLEQERVEERFRDVHLLDMAFQLLHLKPLVDADLPDPCIVVFPSWEKTLETQDEHTQDALGRLFLDFFSYYIGVTLEDESEVYSYARDYEDQFLQKVEQHRLFLPPGGTGSEGIAESIRMYRKDIRTWRSRDYNERMKTWCDGVLVANGIFERLTPQFHLRDNADALAAQPMMWLPAHWHYYKLCAAVSENSLVQKSLLRAGTVAELRALNDPRLRWLGNVPLDALVELREANANLEFRQRLSAFTRELREASADDVDRAATEVVRGISSLLNEHQRTIRRMKEEYKRRHTITAILAWTTLAALVHPWLAPFVEAVGPAAVGIRYLKHKLEERGHMKEAERSLTGFLAAAQHEKWSRPKKKRKRKLGRSKM